MAADWHFIRPTQNPDERFYQNRLGFEELTRLGEHPVMYGAVKRGHAQINIWLCEDAKIPKNTSCRIPVRDIEAFYDECNRQGIVHPDGTLENKPWGTREFTAHDRDGNALRFFSREQRDE